MKKCLVGIISILFIIVSYGLLLIRGLNPQVILLEITNRIQSTITKKPFCKDCNIILISLDTLSANHLPCYGYARNTAPNLCRFAKENIMFENMFSNANYTLPSHVSIFTGLYPSQHKVYTPNVDSLSRSIPFLPEVLQKNGYKTYVYLPSYDSPHLPIDKVFYRGIDKIRNAYNPQDWNEGLHLLRDNDAVGKKTFLFLHTYWVHSPYILENINRKFFIQDDKKTILPQSYRELTKCTPQFLEYLNIALKADIENHFWNGINLEIYKSIYEELVNNPTVDSSFCNSKQYQFALPYYSRAYYSHLLDPSNKEIVNYIKDAYDSKIKELDNYLSHTFNQIMGGDLKKNTIIIVTSDHGEEFMEHGKLEHANNLYDTSIKVPLIMYVPGQSGRKINQLAQSVDIMPTVLKLVGINMDKTVSGMDLFDNNQMDKKDRIVYAEHIMDKVKTIRDARWKLFIENNKVKDIPYELYDMQKDPNEMNNMIYANRDIVYKLQRYLPCASY